MKKCSCKNNLGDIQVTLQDNKTIEIVVDRSPSNPKLVQLEADIEALKEMGLNLGNQIDEALAAKLTEMDLPTKAYLTEILADYSTKEDLETLRSSLQQTLAQEREWAESKFLQKAYISQQAYDQLTPSQLKENTMYIINNNG